MSLKKVKLVGTIVCRTCGDLMVRVGCDGDFWCGRCGTLFYDDHPEGEWKVPWLNRFERNSANE